MYISFPPLNQRKKLFAHFYGEKKNRCFSHPCRDSNLEACQSTSRVRIHSPPSHIHNQLPSPFNPFRLLLLLPQNKQKAKYWGYSPALGISRNTPNGARKDMIFSLPDFLFSQREVLVSKVVVWWRREGKSSILEFCLGTLEHLMLVGWKKDKKGGGEISRTQFGFLVFQKKKKKVSSFHSRRGIYGKPTQLALISSSSKPRFSFSRLLLQYVPTNYGASAPSSLHLAFEILPLDQIRDIVIIVVVFVSAVLLVARVPVPAAAAAVLFLQALVALRQFAQRGQAVGPELVEDAGDEFGEFLVFARAVDGEGVGRNRRMDWKMGWEISLGV